MDKTRPCIYDKWKLPHTTQRSIKVLETIAKRARGRKKRAANLPFTLVPLRFDTRVKLHELHALEPLFLAKLHQSHQDAALAATMKFGQSEKHLRSAQILRNSLSTMRAVKRSGKTVVTFSDDYVQAMLVQRRLESFREGME